MRKNQRVKLRAFFCITIGAMLAGNLAEIVLAWVGFKLKVRAMLGSPLTGLLRLRLANRKLRKAVRNLIGIFDRSMVLI